METKQTAKLKMSTPGPFQAKRDDSSKLAVLQLEGALNPCSHTQMAIFQTRAGSHPGPGHLFIFNRLFQGPHLEKPPGNMTRSTLNATSPLQLLGLQTTV